MATQIAARHGTQAVSCNAVAGTEVGTLRMLVRVATLSRRNKERYNMPANAKEECPEGKLCLDSHCQCSAAVHPTTPVLVTLLDHPHMAKKFGRGLPACFLANVVTSTDTDTDCASMMALTCMSRRSFNTSQVAHTQISGKKNAPTTR